jgi:alcohol dehydrogenase (cytochrome c)
MARRLIGKVLLVLVQSSLVCAGVRAQSPVPYDRLLNAVKEPRNWLMYGGDYASHRYSELGQITPANAGKLNLAWVYQSAAAGSWEATPLVVDGIMYLTQRPNDVVAMDAATGRVFWIYHYNNSPEVKVCCGANNRGLAILDGTLFMGTLDAHLVAIDARSGRALWKTRLVDNRLGYSVTAAPMAVKDKVIVGVGGGELGIRGFIAAFEAKTGKEVWRFYTIPGPGEPGHETWQPCPSDARTYCDPEAWKHGGGSVWVTGSFDPDLNLNYWGVGNPGPDYNGDQRPGDNLYTASVVALDTDTGKLRWHYQFTPHDDHDYDAVQVPVLANLRWRGGLVKAMLWANRNGIFYVLDRTTGRFLLGKPFVKVNWMSGFDGAGRPVQVPQLAGRPIYPGMQGGTNWYGPSFSPKTGLMYISAWEDQGTLIGKTPVEYKPGLGFGGGSFHPFVPSVNDPSKAIPGAQGVPNLRRGPINDWTDAAGHGAVMAIDPTTGELRWKYPMTDVTDSGIITSATDLLVTGGREGYLQILDARTGTLLWKSNLGAQMLNGPIMYEANGKQYIAAIAGLSLFSFALPD